MAKRTKSRKSGPRAKKSDPAQAANRKALWQAYKSLQRRADLAWEKFRDDVKKRAKSDILVQDQNHLLLLLGECNYMARECMRLAGKAKRRRG